ncbi:hypothetical protein CHS0354_036755, partial [Potamilus streckersoni]
MTSSTPTTAPVSDRSRDSTSLPLIDRFRDSTLLPPASSSQLNLPETNSPVLLTPQRTLFPDNPRATPQTFPIVSQTRTFTVQPSNLNSSQPEHSSKTASVLGTTDPYTQ